MENVHAQLKSLTLEGLAAIAASPFGVEGCKHSIASYDTRKDDLVTTLGLFEAAVDALGQRPDVQRLFGAAQARRLVTQFIFNACRRLGGGSTAEAAFEETWADFTQEIGSPTWTYRAVANLQNIQCSQKVIAPDHGVSIQNVIALDDGVSIRGRSYDELSELLDWGSEELACLTKDWMEGSPSSFVMLVETETPKDPDNFIVDSDGSAYQRGARALLAMRLLAPGDVRIGKLFYARPAAFNVGIGGLASTGYSIRNHGPAYQLTPEQAPVIRRLCKDLTVLETRPSKTIRTLLLALRSFSSMYDRLIHQAEDAVVDAITALEALWQIEAELSFKLAFRTATLLAISDDERVCIHKTLRDYYTIRSKVVHGGSLSNTQEGQLRDDEPLRAVVRRALRAFVHLAVNPGEWTLSRLHDEADSVLLHTTKRAALQAAMGIV